jgi:hypothetical protein
VGASEYMQFGREEGDVSRQQTVIELHICVHGTVHGCIAAFFAHLCVTGKSSK